MGIDARPETLPLGSTPSYPPHEWWVAARSEEVRGDLLARRIADMPMVFYRDDDGGVVALEDVCPHRWLPLSHGQREGAQIRCGYHGMVFNPDGSCAEVPSQPEVPTNAAVRSYPVAERWPWIWVWTGDVDNADPTQISPYPWLVDPQWRTIEGYTPLAANYLRGHENVLDLSHFDYLHPGGLGTAEWTTVRPTVTVEDDVLTEVRSLPSAPAAPNTMAMGIAPGSLVDRHNESRVAMPGLHVSVSTVRNPAGHGSEYRSTILHAFTPETERSSHYFFAAARDWRIDDDAIDQQLRQFTLSTFAQDKAALEAIEQVALTYPGRPREYSVRSDKSGLQLRRLIKARILGQAKSSP